MGIAVHTGNRPAPFISIGRRPVPNVSHHLEVISDSAGLRVVLDGKETVVRRFQPLGFGETGLLCLEGEVEVLSLSVKPLSGQSRGYIPALFTGVGLPLAALTLISLLLRPVCPERLKTGAAVSWSVLFPPSVYVLAGLFLGPDTLRYTGRDHLLWLDICLAASGLVALGLIVLLRRCFRAPTVTFNAAALATIAAAVVAAWDGLPEKHPLRLRFTETAEPPGEVIPGNRGHVGPWYSNNRYIGANTYVWRQQFGGERLQVPKPRGVVRIFLLGGSQAWGSGAADSQSTFAELLEQQLRSQGLPVEVFNAGVNGAGMSKVLEYYRQLVRTFEPDIVLADVGLNDSAVLAQKKNPRYRVKHARLLLSLFSRLLNECKKDGTDLVLCLAPMSGELALKPDPFYYSGLAAVASSNNFAVVDPGPTMLEKERNHLVWWDTAHLAPYGHRLMADILYEPVARAVRKRLARWNGRAGNNEMQHRRTLKVSITGGKPGPGGHLQ